MKKIKLIYSKIFSLKSFSRLRLLYEDSNNMFFSKEKPAVLNSDNNKTKNDSNEKNNDFTLYSGFSQEIFTLKDYS